MSNRIDTVVHYTIAANDPIEDKSFHDSGLGFFGIYDGHGGMLCSDYLRRNLHLYLKDEFVRPDTSPLPIEEKLANAFRKLDNAFIEQMTSPSGNSMENCAGSCCIVSLITDVTIRVANAGDSRAILVSKTPLEKPYYRITPLSFDHNANTSEKERQLVAERTTDPNPVRVSDALKDIKEMQPDVDVEEFPLRVAGTLMVTRAIGDAYLKRKECSYPPYQDYCPYITSDPEIITHQLQPEDDFLVMASDGLWEILTNEEVVEIVLDFKRRGLAGNLAEHLVRKLLERRAEQLQFPVEILRHLSPMVRRSVHDDITVYIVFLKPPPSPPTTTTSSSFSSSPSTTPSFGSSSSGSSSAASPPSSPLSSSSPPPSTLETTPTETDTK